MLYIKLISVYIILLVVGYTSRKNDFFFFFVGGGGSFFWFCFFWGGGVCQFILFLLYARILGKKFFKNVRFTRAKMTQNGEKTKIVH